MKGEPMTEVVDAPPSGVESEERLIREAMALLQQKRYSEALLTCEGALVLNPNSIPALSLKGALHERLGQTSDAIRAYERVLELNPLSVSERLRLEVLRSQAQAKLEQSKPIWKETLPVVLAFMGVSLMLIVGLALVLRWSTPSHVAQPPAPAPAETAGSTPRPPLTRPPTEPEEHQAVPRPVPANPSNGAVPPVVLDPSRVTIAPANTPGTSLRGPITPLTSPPAENTRRTRNGSENPSSLATSTPSTSNTGSSEVMPDVQVRETEQRGVYEIRVYPARKGSLANRPSQSAPSNNFIAQAQSHQMAGNYREALNAYRQALAQTEFKGPIFQQMAICYLRLGELANARHHFLQAISEYERQIQQGHDVENARQAIAACQNGLRLCEE